MTATHWKALALTGYFGTFILIVAWYGWLSPPAGLPTIYPLLALGAPLLLPLRGLLHGRAYTYGWSLFLALGYASHALIEVVSTPSDRSLALIELTLVTLWFVGAICYVRKLSTRKK